MKDVTGKYFVDEVAELSSQASYDQEAAQRLWEVSEELTNLNSQETTTESTESEQESQESREDNE